MKNENQESQNPNLEILNSTENKLSKLREYESKIQKLTKELNLYKEQIQILNDKVIQLEIECKNKDEIIKSFNVIQNNNSQSVLLPLSNNENKEAIIFNHLIQLQKLIMKEKLLKEIALDIKTKMFQKIEDNLQSIITMKLNIEEKIYNYEKGDSPITYVLCNDQQNIYKEETLYISKIFLFLRKYQNYLYKILINCETNEEKIAITNLVSNFYYLNIFSTDSTDDEFLLMLYRIIKYEIELIFKHQPITFLENSICEYLLKYLVRNNEVTNYFRKITSYLISTLGNLEHNKFIELDPIKINELMKNEKIIPNNPTHPNGGEIKKPNEDEENIGSTSVLQRPNDKKDFIDQKKFFSEYLPGINIEQLKRKLDKEKDDPQMKDYINYHFNEYNSSQNKTMFTNDLFFENFYQSLQTTHLLEIYRENFSLILEVIEKFFTKIIDSINMIPNSLRYICKIVEILIRHNNPTINEIDLNALIYKFFNEKIIKPNFINSTLNILLIKNVLTSTTKQNIQLMFFIIDHFISGRLFKSDEFPNYTIFNKYFVCKMPTLINFFHHLLNIELPSFLQNFINSNIKSNITDDIYENYYYNSFKEKPKEIMNYRNICISPDQIITVCEIINKHENEFLKEDKYVENVDFLGFQGSYKKLFRLKHIDDIKKIQDEDHKSNPRTIRFILISELNLFQTLNKINKLQPGHFLLEEIKIPKTTEEKNKSILIQAKNILSAILFNIHDISQIHPFKFEITDTKDLIDNVIDVLSHKSSSLENLMQTEWYSLSLKSLLHRLPLEYKEKDYEKYFDELKIDIQQSINSIDLNVFSQVENNLRKTEIKKTEIKNNLEDMEQLEFNKLIQELINEVNVGINLKILKDKHKRKIIVTKYRPSLTRQIELMEESIPNIKPDKDNINTIDLFIQRFPSFCKGHSNIDIFEAQTKYSVPEALNDYYNLMTESIKAHLIEKEVNKLSSQNAENTLSHSKKKKKKDKEKMLNIETNVKKDLNNIVRTIKDYIMSMLYNKLFPKEQSCTDLKIYQQCLKLSWIELYHIGCHEKVKNINHFLSNTNMLLKKLDKTKAPSNKVNILSEIINISLNTLRLNKGNIEGGVDDILPILIFVIIKSRPLFYSSNLSYIQMYYNMNDSITEYQKISLYSTVKELLLNFSHKNVMNITEEEFINNCKMSQEHLES